MKKRRARKTLSSWLTNRYLLIVRQEENFAEKSTFSFTYAKLIVFVFSIFTIFIFISVYLVTTILAQWLDPRHAELEANQRIIELSLAVDSLANEVDQKNLFIDNIQRIISGKPIPSNLSQQLPIDSTAETRQLDNGELHPIDSQFRKEFEEKGNGFTVLASTTVSTSRDELRDVFFFSPISGIITSAYNAKIEHYGVDVVAKEKEPVKCALDGTVIFSDWSQESGYVVAVQHRGNLISVYKHNSEILKEVGNFVKAGEVIAIIGNTGEMTTGPHLHFELWYNGNPIDPEEFVSF